LADTNAHAEHPICDYEGTSYRARFWEGRGRDYEDLAERIALQRLLPANGRRLLDLGAGFGRLADLYDGYEQVVLLDYARSGLLEAQARLGRGGRFVYVAADIYNLPLAPRTLDTVVSVRVLHHLKDVPAALRAIADSLRPGGAYVLEYANKRNLKAIARYLLKRQSWSPFTAEPYEFVELNFDFHPRWMVQELADAGFTVKDALAVSHFRHPAFKRLLPARQLARLDGALQRPLAGVNVAPSAFLATQTDGQGAVRMDRLFACPRCRGEHFAEVDQNLRCAQCQTVWANHDGIYDFKTPLVEGTSAE